MPERGSVIFDLTEESATRFLRKATIGGKDLREIIVLDPGRKATVPREGPYASGSMTIHIRTRRRQAEHAAQADQRQQAPAPGNCKELPLRHSTSIYNA